MAHSSPALSGQEGLIREILMRVLWFVILWPEAVHLDEARISEYLTSAKVNCHTLTSTRFQDSSV